MCATRRGERGYHHPMIAILLLALFPPVGYHPSNVT
jgi:hypothetical protein